VLQQLRSWLTAHESGIILGLIAAGVALRTLLVVASPTTFGYVWDVYADGVKLLVTEGRLPVAVDCWQCYHPPVFYLLGAPLFALGRLFDAPGSDVWAHRFTAGLSLPAAGVVFYYGFRLLRLFGCRGASLVTGLALLLITPVLFISSYGAEADIVMTALLAAFIYYLTVYAAHPSTASRSDVLLIGLLAGLAAATKYSGLVAIATAGIVFGLQLGRGPARGRTVRQGLIVLAVCLVTGGWKYWDNVERYGHPLHATGSAAEGLSVGARASGAPYEFTTMRLGQVRELFGLASPRGALTTFPVYQSVPTTLHALTWSDMSLFSRRTRHGLSTDPYRYKRIPTLLVMTVIVLGFVPEALAIVGLVVTWRRRAFVPLAAFGVVTCAAYLWWLLPQSEWALKSKYVLCLLPPAVLYTTVGQAWLARRWPVAGAVSALLLLGLVVVAHVYLYAFAVGGL